ncbi:RecB family exonuclease [Ramlibacter sp.]|uniref:RecB family exonuclease n=1 Tax=Ramlibacter sp. TaxID=1917967 RepID=UPI002FCB0105
MTLDGSKRSGSAAALQRTRPIRPSKLGLFNLCALRYLFETERPDLERLSPAPAALLGSAFHKVIETGPTQNELSGKLVRELIRDEFRKAVLSNGGWLARWACAREGIDSVLPRSLLDQATQLTYHELKLRPIAAGRAAIARGDFPSEKQMNPFGSELWLHSDKMDIEGRADLIEQRGSVVHVVDYKLGATRAGEPNPDYVLQLSAYAMVALERLGPRKVVLELRSPRATWAKELDDGLRANVLQTLQQIQTVLPKHEYISSEALATPGTHCMTCSYRPSCTTYARGLLGRTPSDFLSPYDVAGSTESTTSCDGFTTIRIRAEPDDRAVSITAVPSAMLDALLGAGSNVVAYSLKSPETMGRGRYVANFHAWNRITAVDSAYSCSIGFRQ